MTKRIKYKSVNKKSKTRKNKYKKKTSRKVGKVGKVGKVEKIRKTKKTMKIHKKNKAKKGGYNGNSDDSFDDNMIMENDDYDYGSFDETNVNPDVEVIGASSDDFENAQLDINLNNDSIRGVDEIGNLSIEK